MPAHRPRASAGCDCSRRRSSRPASSAIGQLRRVVCTSTSASRPCAAAQPIKYFSSPGRKRRDNQQHGIGAGGPRFEDLIVGHHEVLAKQRNIDCRTDHPQVIERPIEEGRLGQHRNRRRACASVVRRDRHRVVVRAQDPSRRRAALALGNHVDPVGACERRQESGPPMARARRRVLRSVLRSVAHDATAAPGDSRSSRTATMHRVAATMVASRSAVGPPVQDSRARSRHNGLGRGQGDQAARASDWASPRSIAADAWRIPSSTDDAAPAMNRAAPAFSSTTSRGAPALAVENAHR